jgi:hypothetical protein
MSQHNRRLLFLSGAIGFGALVLVLTHSMMISTTQMILAIGIVLVGAIPTLWSLRAANPSYFPLFSIVGLFYAISFGAPFLVLDLIWPEGIADIDYYRLTSFPVRDGIATLNAMVLVLGGITAFAATFIFVRPRISKIIGHLRFSANPNPTALRLLCYGLLLGFLAHEFIPIVQKLPSLPQFLGRVGFVAFAVLFVAWQERLIGKYDAVLIFGVILPAVIIHRAITGLYTPILLLGLLFFFLIWPAYKKWASVIAIVSTLFLGLFYVPAQEYRTQTALSRYTSVGENSALSRKAEFFVKISAAVWSGEKTVRFKNQEYTLHGVNILTLTGRRIFLMPLFAHVYGESPDNIPYWGGETYKNLLTKFIPRAVWADKPEERFGREFGVRYGMIAPNDQTSINIPWIIELLANFGPLGVLLGMAVIGIFFAGVDRFFNSREMPPLERAVGLGIVFRLAYPESNFSVMCGDLVPLTIVLFLYFHFGLKWLGPLFGTRTEIG